MSAIRVLSAGGTIDKIYFDAKSSYEVGPPAIEDMISGLQLNQDFFFTALMRKDSLEMDEKDREKVLEAVTDCSEELILITHGTDTMVETAYAIGRAFPEGNLKKTIVLTGSMKPAIFKDTDAFFNVGCAVAALQILDSGIYIAMSGEIFPYNKVRKDRELGKFVLQ
jgi:L-asparaginase